MRATLAGFYPHFSAIPTMPRHAERRVVSAASGHISSKQSEALEYKLVSRYTTRNTLMARLPYVHPSAITDPQIAGWLEDARREGRPGPENQAIRAHQPDVMRSFTMTRKWLFDGDAGVLDHDLKELLRAYIAHTIECGY